MRVLFNPILLIAAALALCLAGCEKGAPPLDDTVTLSIFAEPTTIKNFGDVARIRVRAFQSDGRPAIDGTVIILTAATGSIPDRVTLLDGIAETIYQSGTETGTVVITAQSGSVGADGSVSTSIEIIDGRILVGAVNMGVNPNNLPAVGGRVDVRLVITDTDGFPIPGKSVIFSSDRGRLASNGGLRFSDRNGVASDTLTVPQLVPAAAMITVSAQVEDQVYQSVITLTANQNPVPSMVISPSDIGIGDKVFFDGSASSDGDGSIVNFAWNFGDGATASGQRAEHSYAAEGTYTASLRVSDDMGAAQSISAAVVVAADPSNISPVAAFTFSPLEPRTGTSILFDGQQSSDSDGFITSYQWEFGDGSTPRQGITVSHPYAGAGTYTVTLRVVDDDGASSVISGAVAVTGNTLPVAMFTSLPVNPTPGDDVAFDASTSTDADGTVVSYGWSFGDGEVMSGASPFARHTYSRAGSYEVFLTIRDNDNGLGFVSGNVTVSSNPPPVAMFTFSPEAPVAGAAVLFDASESFDDGVIDLYSWSFGDGSSGVGKTVSHTFDTAGDFQVLLFVQDNEGALGTTSTVVTVAAATTKDRDKGK